MQTLSDLKTNQKALITKVQAPEKLLNRLTDFGFTPGCEIELIGNAPLGDPMLVKIRGCQIAIRREDACLIEIEPMESKGEAV